MKRREGSSRRPVLDIDNSTSSWKNKYQNIAERGANGTAGKGGSSSNPLSKMVGGYASGSDDEDDNRSSKNSLDAKVEEFMKEVESTKTSDEASLTCAWQECYDEGTGYPYYWNMNTNEVTWEPPPELVAYQAVVAAKAAQTEAKAKAQAQQAQWAVEQAALGLTPEYPIPEKRIPSAPPKPKKPSKASKPSFGPPPGNHQNRMFMRKPPSDSEDEKIEMITSWVDEESEEDDDQSDQNHRPSGDKKIKNEVSSKSSKCPPNAPTSSRKGAKPPKPAPPPAVVFGPQLPPADSHSKVKSRSRNGSTEESSEVESKVVIQKLRRLKTESDVIVGTRERVPVRKSLDRSRSGSPNDRLNLLSGKSRLLDVGSDSEIHTENSLRNKLVQQVQVLRDLGGTVPSSVKDLLNLSAKSSSSLPMTAADSIIAMIEMEQPPDHKRDEKLLSSLNSAVQTVQKSVQKLQAEKFATVSDNKTVNGTPKPTSFALIAGYGDDSDQEDATDSEASAGGKDLPDQKDKPVSERSLFPILNHEDSFKDISTKPLTKPVSGFDPSSSKVSVEVAPKAALILDPGPAAQKRKKRLDIGAIQPQPSTSTSSNSSDATEETSKSTLGPPQISKEGPSSGTVYTTVWTKTSTYASDPTANDRRGFGFQTVGEEEQPTTTNPKLKKGKIQFIKAETINLQGQDDSTNVRDGDKNLESKSSTAKSLEDEESRRSLSSLAQLVKAKLRFLSEGKEPVSPVQAMAIQIETLVSAWNAGALTYSFLQRWLQSTGAELVELERAAAPEGWAVQWDRTYKRYFYCNLATKDTQWDFPLAPGEESQKDESKEDSTEPKEVTPPSDDEDAMELCTTPPPEEEGTIEPEPPSRPLSPQLNPPPSKRMKTDTDGCPNIKAMDTPECPPHQPPLPSTPPPLPASPPPPPPPPDTPPPPPPDTPPAPPPRTLVEHGEPLPPGVDTPEVPFIPVRPSMPPSSMGPHMALNPMQSVGPLHPGPVMGGVAVPVMAGMTMQYPAGVSSSYVAPPPTEAMLASYNHAATVDYMGYMGVYAGPSGPMPIASVAAPPLAYTGPPAQAPAHPPTTLPHRKKEALMSELNSFYSDIASLDSNSRDATEDDTSQDGATVEPAHVKASTPPVAISSVPVPSQSSDDTTKLLPPSETSAFQMHNKSQSTTSEFTGDSSTKKKKKPKLAPGLTLKKKGVSNLVAKWQQVQQEVWKDYQEEEDDE